MHHAIVFNYFVPGTQASDILGMAQFHKVFITGTVIENPHKNY